VGLTPVQRCPKVILADLLLYLRCVGLGFGCARFLGRFGCYFGIWAVCFFLLLAVGLGVTVLILGLAPFVVGGLVVNSVKTRVLYFSLTIFWFFQWVFT
jgi:hypothetical protein